MKRDAWYAAIAAFGLCAAAAGYALIKAPKLADPKVSLARPKLTASLPSPPQTVIDLSVLRTAQTILRERDPFVEREDDETSAGRGLDLPKLGPPVRFSNPDAEATVTAVQPSAPAALQPQSAIPQAPVPETTATATQAPPVQGSLTLRGVYPTPNGGRALVAMPDGRVVSVGVGGVVGGWRVLQIQQGAIRLGRGQRAILLAMPR